MIETKTWRCFKQYGRAINYCIKYNLSFLSIERQENEFRVIATQQDINSFKIPCIYRDRYGNYWEVDSKE